MLFYLDYGILAALFVSIFILFRRTEVVRIATAVLTIFMLSVIAETFDLIRTAAVLKLSTQTLLLGMIVIFNPELRMISNKIRRSPQTQTSEAKTLQEIEKAVFSMSKQRIGALIFLDHSGEIPFSAEHMTRIDGKLSSSLLETIFYPNSALHDGAVMIQKGRISYAGCKLPLSARRHSDIGNLGTRHMVAYETAERFNSIAIVVSEQTGDIRLASKDGFTLVSTREEYYRYFNIEQPGPKPGIISRIFKIKS